MMYTISRGAITAMLCIAAVAATTGIANAQAKPALVRNVDEDALQPFQANLFPHSSGLNTATDSFVVPAGKRLVIEYTSGQPQDLSGGYAGMTLSTTAGGSTVAYIVYVSATNTNQVNQLVKIYADPGSTVQAFSFNNPPASSTAGTLNISGHLINYP